LRYVTADVEIEDICEVLPRKKKNLKEVLGHRNILALFTSSQKHTITNEISEIINNKRQRTS
jgi:uncharacterized protein (UPF0216 family)